MPRSKRRGREIIRKLTAVVHSYEVALEDFKKKAMYLRVRPTPENQAKIDEAQRLIDNAREEIAKVRVKYTRRKPSTT